MQYLDKVEKAQLVRWYIYYIYYETSMCSNNHYHLQISKWILNFKNLNILLGSGKFIYAYYYRHSYLYA